MLLVTLAVIISNSICNLSRHTSVLKWGGAVLDNEHVRQRTAIIIP